MYEEHRTTISVRLTDREVDLLDRLVHAMTPAHQDRYGPYAKVTRSDALRSALANATRALPPAV